MLARVGGVPSATSGVSGSLDRGRHGLAMKLATACGAQLGAGVPAGSGKTGLLFGLIELKQSKTFLPLFSVGTYLSPDTWM